MLDTSKRAAIGFCALLIFLLGQSALAAQNRHATSNQANSSSDRLANKVEWGTIQLRLLEDNPRKVEFSLATSWIPGEDRKGMFRYRLDVRPVPDKENPLSVIEMEKLLTEVNACNLYLRLMDADQFELRTIPLFLQKNVNSEVWLIGLSANSSASMSAAEYRSFVGTSTASGTWTINWNCPEQAPKKE
jgi:hypothetical protein